MHIQFVKNVVASWAGLITTAAVAFFLTPFILHHIGNIGYGLWVLVFAFTGYYGLLDFGLRSAVTRFVARYAANNDWGSLSRVVSTVMLSYLVVGLLIVIVTGIVAWQFDLLFKVPSAWSSTGRSLLLIVGVGMGLGVPLGCFAGVLEGLQRFTILGTVQVVTALMRALLVVLALESGHGIVALGVISVVLNLSSYSVYVFASFHFCPQLQIRWNYSQKGTLRELVGFGVITFWIMIAQRLRFQTDSLVIAAFLSVQVITFFDIASKLVNYSTDMVQTMAQVLTPMASSFDAKSDLQQLRRVFLVGNRYSGLIVMPLAAILLVLGKTIIRVWVGPQYLSSYTVLAILTVPTTLYLAQAASTKVLYGMNRHSTLAWVLLLEGLANLALSIILVRWWGVMGVALGTAIPLACTSLLFLPSHLCRLLGLRVWDYLRRAYAYPVLLSLPFILVLWGANRWIQPRSYLGLLAVLLVGGAVYGLELLVYFRVKEQKEMQEYSKPAGADQNPAADRIASDA